MFRQCVLLALGTQREIVMNNIFICGLCGCTIFFLHYPTNVTIFEKKNTEHKTCFDFLYKFSWNVSHSSKKWARYDQICTL